MRIVVDNANIVIQDADPEYLAALEKRLTYKDKSVEYQLQRMSKSPFQKNSPYFKKLQKQLYGSMVEQVDDNYVIPSGFFKLVPDGVEVVDLRKETGDTISLPWNNKPFDPRPYQEEAVEEMVNNYRGVINFATGLGKTLTTVHALRHIKKKALIVCPGTSIADNFHKELCEAFGEHRIGYFGNGKKKIRDITVGIAGSVNNHVEKFKDAGLGVVVYDEVHHLAASTFYAIAEALGGVGRMYGLTATNFRSDGKDIMIEAGVGPVLAQRDLIWGISNGWLAKPFIVVRDIETLGREFKNDKNKNYKEHVLKSDQMNSQIIADAAKMLNAGKSTLILVKEIPHGQMLADQLGLPFATGSDKKSNEYVEQLNRGEIPGLIGTDAKVGEGTDTKNVDVLILANFVASKGPLWQNLGRGLRIHKGQDKLIVLDYIPKGSSMLTRHGMQRVKYYREITQNVSLR
jgi:superfamily II DNA or RNA helicase